MFSRDASAWGFKPYLYSCVKCTGQVLPHFSKFESPFVPGSHACHLVYKCLNCDLLYRHPVGIDEDYKRELLERRKGKDPFVPFRDDPDFFYSLLDSAKEREVKSRLGRFGYL